MKTINLYTGKEILAMENKEATERVMDELTYDYQVCATEFYFKELRDTLNAFAEKFNTKLIDWSFSVDGGSCENYGTFDIESFTELTNHEKNDAIKQYNGLDMENDCPLTGVYTDGYVYDYISKNFEDGLTFNNIVKILKKLPTTIIREFSKNEFENSMNIEVLLEMPIADEEIFDENGYKIF